MSTRIPKAWETSWAQQAIKDELARKPAGFEYPGHDTRASGERVYLVDREGTCRVVDASLVRTEHWRISDVLSRATVPSGCSDRILAAPARGSISEFREVRVLPDGDGFKVVDAPYRAGCPGRVRDIFDVMTEQATRRGGNPPFTLHQVDAARSYRDLHQRVHAAGVKCSKTFDDHVSGSGQVDFMDAYIRDARRLEVFHDAIGISIAKDMKPRAPSNARRAKISDDMLKPLGKRIITTRSLVDDVCIKEKSLSDVLRAFGWSATGKNRNSLRAALCAALARMQGL